VLVILSLRITVLKNHLPVTSQTGFSSLQAKSKRQKDKNIIFLGCIPTFDYGTKLKINYKNMVVYRLTY